MSLQHALLTSLLESASSGLDLANRFSRSIGHFWQASHQQIYRELARMEASGWVVSMPAESGRGRKRAYQATEAGRAELSRWVKEQVDPKPLRNEMMVRVRAEAALGTSDLLPELARHLAFHQAKLAQYAGIEQRHFSRPDLSRAERIQHLVLRAGIMNEQMFIQTAQQALEILALPDDAAAKI
jgi:DNA-binding PadR family transcriptional regulator